MKGKAMREEIDGIAYDTEAAALLGEQRECHELEEHDDVTGAAYPIESFYIEERLYAGGGRWFRTVSQSMYVYQASEEHLSFESEWVVPMDEGALREWARRYYSTGHLTEAGVATFGADGSFGSEWIDWPTGMDDEDVPW